MKNMLLPNQLNSMVAVREITGSYAEERAFRVQSLEIHLGISLKENCEELPQQIFQVRFTHYKKMVERCKIFH